MNIKNKIKEFFKYRKVDTCHYLGDWYSGWHSWTFRLTFCECGYEEGYAHLNIALLGWYNMIQLPFIKSKRFPDGDCDEPEWGIAIHDATLWIYKGGNGNMKGGSKWWTWNLPWFTHDHVRHEIEILDPETHQPRMINYKELENMTDSKTGKRIYYRDNELINRHYADYTDKYDGTVVTAEFYVEEREWRRKWFHWTKLGNIVKRYIEINFSDEVGSRKGSWKGGTVGCSYDLLPGETPEECLKRMERERSFDR